MTTISPTKKRASDIKLLAILTAGVLVIGFLIAGGILFLTRGGAPTECGQLNGGSLTDLVPRAATAPSFIALGKNCQYWLALRDGHLVAIKPTIASLDCRVDWKPQNNHFTCGDQAVSYAQLDYFPAKVGTGAFKGSWIIDFGDENPTTTT